MRKWKPYGSRTDQGAWLDLANMFPTEAGTYRTANAFATYFTAAAGPASPGTTLTSWFGQTADGTITGYVGTSTKLYRCSSSDLSSGTFTDASKGGGYTASQWSFCQFGNYTIACDGAAADAVQVRDATGSGAFADLSGSPPKAKICVTQSNCVLLFNISGAANGWMASDVGAHTTWDGSGDSVTTTYILNRAGPITAACAFRDEVLVWKAASMYRMRYVGSPVKWVVELIADGIGAARMGSVCNTGSLVVFTGVQGAYIYDGSAVRRIGEGFGAGSNLLEDAGSDSQPAIFYQSTNHVLFKSNTNAGWYVYNITSDSWGKFLPYDTSGNALTSWVGVGSNAGALSYPLGIGDGSVVIVNLSQNPCVRYDVTESSNTVPATISTSLYGSDNAMTAFSRVVPRFNKTANWSYTVPSATQLSMTPYTASNPAGTETAGSSVTSSTNNLRFDYQNNVRWARFNLSLPYACEIEDVAIEAKFGGSE